MKCLFDLFSIFQAKHSSPPLIHLEQLTIPSIELPKLDLTTLPKLQIPLIVPMNLVTMERECANHLIMHYPPERALISFLDLDSPSSRGRLVGALEPKDDSKRDQGKYSLTDFCSRQLGLPPQGSARFEEENRLPDNVTARVDWRS